MLNTNRVLVQQARLLSCVVLALCALLPATTSALAQQPSGDKLAKVEFEGAKRLSRDQLLKESGLEIGQPLDVATLDAAAQRLLDSGLLKKLSYRLHTDNKQATVIFESKNPWASGIRSSLTISFGSVMTTWPSPPVTTLPHLTERRWMPET